MTGLGKALALATVLFSGFAAVWAFGLWVENVDWSDKRAQGDKEAGKLGERLARIDVLKPGTAPITRAWSKSRSDVALREEGLNQDRAWYVKELQHNDTLATEGDPAREVERANNMPVLDAGTNRPKMQAVKGLQSLVAYDKLAEETSNQVLTEAKGLKKLIDDDTKYTEALAGTETRKGMYLQIADERARKRGLIDERERLKPFITNMEVESRLVLQRQKEMQDRIKELEAYLLRVYNYKAARPQTKP